MAQFRLPITLTIFLIRVVQWYLKTNPSGKELSRKTLLDEKFTQLFGKYLPHEKHDLTISKTLLYSDDMQPLLLSQNDPRWKGTILGESQVTIGGYGCTITCIAMKYGLNPEQVNLLFNQNGVFAAPASNPRQKNLVNWTKIGQALPGVSLGYRYYEYNNEVALQNMPCLVEVDFDGTDRIDKRHWVLFIGNQRLYDPWDGQEKPTNTYKALGMVVLNGEYKNPNVTPASVTPPTPVAESSYYKGIDTKNLDSVKVTIDTWEKVKDGKFISLEEHTRQLQAASNLLPDVMSQQDKDDLDRYREMQLMGYTTANDITNAIEKEADNYVALQKEVVDIRNRNGTLLKMVSKIEEEDSRAAELGQKAIEQNKELNSTLKEIAKVSGANKMNATSIVTSILGLKDTVDRFVKTEESKRAVSTPVEKPKTDGVSFFLKLFQAATDSKEVK